MHSSGDAMWREEHKPAGKTFGVSLISPDTDLATKGDLDHHPALEAILGIDSHIEKSIKFFSLKIQIDLY